MTATAGSGGSDFADLYDSPGNDTFAGEDSSGHLFGPGYSIRVSQFAVVRATASAGGFDQLVLGSLSYVFQPFGNWR